MQLQVLIVNWNSPHKTNKLNKTRRNIMDTSPGDSKETRSSNNQVTYRPFPSHTLQFSY